MESQQPASPRLVQMVDRTLGSPLKAGELGVVLARAGVGKTACLTHIALEQLLRGEPVLHVCIDDSPDKIKVWYKEFLRNLSESQSSEEAASLKQRIAPLRFILAYLHQAFNPAKLELSLNNLREQAKFCPSMVVLDGLDFDRVSRPLLETLREFAQQHQVSLWMSARTHRHRSQTNERGVPYPCHELDDLFEAILLLEPLPEAIRVRAIKHQDLVNPKHGDVLLNTQTYLMLKD